MDKFDTSVSILISAVVGAGVFALPVLAKQVGLVSIFIILAAFGYMLGLGYMIISMFPGTVEDEVERYLGKGIRTALVLIEYAIVFLALTSYLLGIRLHIGVKDTLIFIMMVIPLIMQLHFPAVFTNSLAFFTLAFVSFLTLASIPGMQLPTSFIDISTFTTPSGLLSTVLLFLVSIFAFYGHNMIPRIRNIIRNKRKTEKIVYTGLSIVFLLYLPFTIAVSGLGADDMATIFLTSALSEPWASLIGLLAVVIFYTSFVLFSLKMLDDMGHSWENTVLVLLGAAVLYYMTILASIPFHFVIAAAGLGVSMYSFLVAFAAVKAKKLPYIAYSNILMNALIWIFLLAQFF